MITDQDMGVTCDGLDEKCTAQAYYVVSQHRVGHCNLGVNVVRMLCPQHAAMVLQANAFTEPFACTRCNRVFHTLHDLIDVAHIVTGASLA
jgi:hypothetical protein